MPLVIVVAAAVFGIGLLILKRRATGDYAGDANFNPAMFNAIDQLPEAKVVEDPIKPGVKVPRGIRNNNPGNLEGNTAWEGLATPRSDGVYLRFVDAAHGLRALAINLLNQERKHDLYTIADIITKFAPPSENDTASYIQAVSDETGIAASEVIDFETQPGAFADFIKAIIVHENGENPYADNEISGAIEEAFIG